MFVQRWQILLVLHGQYRRYGKIKAIIKTGEQTEALMPLPPAALRLETDILNVYKNLGCIKSAVL